jgi:hypothetical protein
VSGSFVARAAPEAPSGGDIRWRGAAADGWAYRRSASLVWLVGREVSFGEWRGKARMRFPSRGGVALSSVADWSARPKAPSTALREAVRSGAAAFRPRFAGEGDHAKRGGGGL